MSHLPVHKVYSRDTCTHYNAFKFNEMCYDTILDCTKLSNSSVKSILAIPAHITVQSLTFPILSHALPNRQAKYVLKTVAVLHALGNISVKSVL